MSHQETVNDGFMLGHLYTKPPGLSRINVCYQYNKSNIECEIASMA